MKKAFSILTNRYFIFSIGFAVWMLFFDQRDFFQQKERSAELQKLESAKKYYQTEIDKTQKQLNELQNSPSSVEKFARERYLLRRDGEEVYLFEDTLPKSTNK